ncbi:MAG: LysR substrate-binding domain-containing protein, partial [Myxococcota bacterium]
MRWKWMTVFLALCEELHFARTAARLGVSQPAVSRAIASLEAWLDVQLVDRSSRHVSLTPAGVVFERGARQTVERLEFAVREVRAGQLATVAEVRLGTMIGASQPPVGAAVAALRERHPVAKVTLVSVGEGELASALHDGEVDAVLAWEESVPSGLFSRLVAAVPLVVLVPEGHPLARQDVVTWADLASEEVILPTREAQPVVSDRYRQLAAEHGRVPRLAAHVSTATDLLMMVASGVGIGHAPLPDELGWRGVVARPHEPRIDIRYVVAWSTTSPAVTALLEDDIAPLLIGEDPRRIEHLWKKLWWATHYIGRGGLASFAMSAVDIALWDLKARLAGEPLWRFLGGVDSKAEAYGGGIDFHMSIDELLKQTEGFLADGLRAVKIKVGRESIAEECRRLKAVRG